MPPPPIVQEKTSVLDIAAETHTITFDSPTTEGNWVLIFIHVRGGITEEQVTLITPASGVTAIANGVASGIGKLFRFKVTAGQEQTYVIDHNNTGSNVAGSFAAIVEISGSDPTNPVDVSVVDVINAEVSLLTVGDLITTIANSLLLIFVGVRAGGADNSWTASDFFVIGNARDGMSTSGTQPSGGGWGVRSVTVTGTYASLFDWTDDGRCVGIGVAIFEDQTPPPPPLPEYAQGRAAIGDPSVYGATIVRS